MTTIYNSTHTTYTSKRNIQKPQTKSMIFFVVWKTLPFAATTLCADTAAAVAAAAATTVYYNESLMNIWLDGC